ncbi:hypothetical protein Emin_0460 [Elusimicrobium minutum Pei191]|uniref:Lipoprotein n=1 Tax=Elusimicrobium minutum (strain Pei191) TaxID=445932 RepID=B2KBJ5_ELUMP|nr:hypothetical protein [Elusimicrobium minutum]ACC98017.1 hypothetical protein Emin_0460 [Elusimicrobium minutum Pei191]
MYIKNVIFVMLIPIFLYGCTLYHKDGEKTRYYHIISMQPVSMDGDKKIFDKETIKYQGYITFSFISPSAGCVLCESNNLRNALFDYAQEGFAFKKFYLEKPEPKLPWFKVYEGKNKRGVSGWYVEGILYPGECGYWDIFEKIPLDFDGKYYRIIKYATGRKYLLERIDAVREGRAIPAENKDKFAKSVKLLKGESFAK